MSMIECPIHGPHMEAFCPQCNPYMYTFKCVIHHEPLDSFGNCPLCSTLAGLNHYCNKHKHYWTGISQCMYCQGEHFWNKESGEMKNMNAIKKERRYMPTISDLLDRLTIVQQKELKIPEHREEYTKEIQDLIHDINLCLREGGDVGEYGKYGAEAVSKLLRDIIVLTLMNCEIWHNESLERQGKGDGSGLRLSHSLNGIRNTAKNKIQESFGGRKDFKIDNCDLFPNWVPSGYGEEKSDKTELCENCGSEPHPNMACEEFGVKK